LHFFNKKIGYIFVVEKEGIGETRFFPSGSQRAFDDLNFII